MQMNAFELKLMFTSYLLNLKRLSEAILLWTSSYGSIALGALVQRPHPIDRGGGKQELRTRQT